MPYIAKDIEEYHYDIADDETNPAPVDDAKADAILYCIARERRKQEELIAQADDQIKKIELWRDGEVDKYKREIDRQTERLQLYFLSLVAADPNLKTKNLSNGTIKTRKQRDQLVIEAENDFIEWHKDSHFVTTKTIRQINKKKVEDYIKKTGDLPELCKLNIRDDKFSVTTN